jgi:hypothetical protein
LNLWFETTIARQSFSELAINITISTAVTIPNLSSMLATRKKKVSIAHPTCRTLIAAA